MENNFARLFVVVVLFVTFGCNRGPSVQTLPPTTRKIESAQLSEGEKKKNIENANKEISKSQEIPVGEENFQKLADYILKHGFDIYGGNSKQYTFFDSKGNRHAFLAQKMGPSGERSKTGKVGRIVVYGYYQGIKDQEHFFSYDITKEKVICLVFELDGSWKDVEAVTFGYKEFLRKAEN